MQTQPLRAMTDSKFEVGYRGREKDRQISQVKSSLKMAHQGNARGYGFQPSFLSFFDGFFCFSGGFDSLAREVPSHGYTATSFLHSTWRALF